MKENLTAFDKSNNIWEEVVSRQRNNFKIQKLFGINKAVISRFNPTLQQRTNTISY